MLSALVIIDHCGRQLTKSYTVALKCTFLIIRLLLLWRTLSAHFSLVKISVIHSSFPSDSQSHVLNPPDKRKILQNLSCVAADEVHRPVLLAPCKSLDFDPIPTSLVKDGIDILITPITSTINVSFTNGSFISHFKSALVSPLLKKPSLNKDSLIKYRPVSNRSVLSIVLEKIVVNHLISYIKSSNKSNHYQSAYREFHSTETALLKIHNDILASPDAGKVTAPTLLDLSTAFDTIDRTILWRRLNDWFGVTGKALDWFQWYLTGRCQRTRLGDCLSSKADLTVGVLQVSVLGPLLLSLYTTPLSSMIS